MPESKNENPLLKHFEQQERKRLSFLVAEGSKAKESRPMKNQDALMIMPEQGFFAVFDGVGGSKDSEEGSLLAASVMQRLGADQETWLPLDKAQEFLKIINNNSNRAILDLHISGEGPQTTATYAKFAINEKGESCVVVGNIGDSRAYLLRDRKLVRLTQDDDAFDFYGEPEVVESLRKKIDTAQRPDLDMKEWRLFGMRHVVSELLGVENNHMRLTIQPVQEGDVIFLATDGITDPLTTPEMESILSSSLTNSQKIERLMEQSERVNKTPGAMRAKEGGDDMTAILITLRAADIIPESAS